MHDAYSLAGLVLEDHYAVSPAAGSPGPMAQTPQQGLPDEISKGLKDGSVVDLQRWQRIDTAEQDRGKATGKLREKFRTVEEMLSV